MRIKTICSTVFLLLLILASGLFAQSKPNTCPIDLEGQTISAPPPQPEEPTSPPKSSYTVPRKQVLIEAFTRTT